MSAEAQSGRNPSRVQVKCRVDPKPTAENKNDFYFRVGRTFQFKTPKPRVSSSKKLRKRERKMQQAAARPPTQESAATGDAPPKQVAQALEQLGQAGRLIADVRLGADRLLEALFTVGDAPHHQHSSKCLNLIIKEESLMRHHLQNLRAIGRQLEESGVLNDSLRSRSNSWGLHMPLVCPDGAVVAYAWKRQLAGQAGASAVDRTR
ncbi:hypothetical protein CDL12_26567 [Handroanthus impetiginosus]|uniref:Uncharacterized protein n=1 Tax=Handroanthus impetiginosus TaxID=429701 RepID=A0A2G9G6J6_9LAMI|nr:hypothetical protein CDL12_26567 [Handroanthus impetiginosus]